MTREEDLAAEIAKNALKIKEPCEDTISRDVAKAEYRKRFINNLKDDKRDIDLSKYAEEPCKKFDEFIDSLPSAQTVECNDMISREDANELAQELVYTTSDKTDYITNLFDGLSKLSSVQPKVECNDTISREAVREFVERIQTIKDSHNENGTPINYGTICDLVIQGWKLMKLPSVQPSRKGHWKRFEDDKCYWYGCSRCKHEVPRNEWGYDDFSPFCPNCGACMKEGSEE